MLIYVFVRESKKNKNTIFLLYFETLFDFYYYSFWLKEVFKVSRRIFKNKKNIVIVLLFISVVYWTTNKSAKNV